MDEPTSPTKLDLRKQERVRELRRQFCPRDAFPETSVMIRPDGSINRDYFSVRIRQDDQPWTDDDTARLQQGIQRFGVGKFDDMRRELLPERSTTLLRVKTMRMLGSRDLRRYLGWRGSPELIAKEHEKNRAAGDANGTWVNGVIDPAEAAKRARAQEEQQKQDEDRGKRRKGA